MEKKLLCEESFFWIKENGLWYEISPVIWNTLVTRFKKKMQPFKIVKTRYYNDGSVECDKPADAVVFNVKLFDFKCKEERPNEKKLFSIPQLYYLQVPPVQLGPADVNVVPVPLHFGDVFSVSHRLPDVIGFIYAEKSYYPSGVYVPGELEYIFFQEAESLADVLKAAWLPMGLRRYLCQGGGADYHYIHIPERKVIYPFQENYNVIPVGFSFNK